MTTSKPTPGPWTQGYTLQTPITRSWSAEQIAENNEREKRMVFANFSHRDQGRSRVLVADCRRPEDARLIIAAPDLLAALKLCRSVLGTAQHEIHDQLAKSVIGKRIAEATAAIAKAEGAQ